MARIKGKNTKKCVRKQSNTFKNHKHFLVATQLETKINQLQKIVDDFDLRGNHKEFTEN